MTSSFGWASGPLPSTSDPIRLCCAASGRPQNLLERSAQSSVGEEKKPPADFFVRPARASLRNPSREMTGTGTTRKLEVANLIHADS